MTNVPGPKGPAAARTSLGPVYWYWWDEGPQICHEEALTSLIRSQSSLEGRTAQQWSVFRRSELQQSLSSLIKMLLHFLFPQYRGSLTLSAAAWCLNVDFCRCWLDQRLKTESGSFHQDYRHVVISSYRWRRRWNISHIKEPQDSLKMS